MKETLSIFITAIVFVLLIVVFPLYNYFERQDDMSYNLVLKCTTDFVDEVINTGYISQEMYTDYISQLANTGNLYDIQLEAHKKVLTKSDSSDEYEEQFVIDYNDDIFSAQVSNTSNINNKVIKNGVYRLNVGDKIYIKLKNSSTTMAGALFNIIVPTSSPETIKVNYGGIVQNNTWEQADTPLFEEYNVKLSFDLNTNGDTNASYNDTTLQKGITQKLYTGTSNLKFTVPNSIPTRTNCTFKGWTTDKNSNVVEILPGKEIKLDKSTTLYAVWNYNAITMTLNANGGTPATQSKTLTYGSNYTVLNTVTKPTMNGYIFDGWYTAATGGTQITATAKVTSTNNVTLYAHWKATQMTITLNANGGSVSPASLTGTYKEKYTGLPTPTRTGYTFAAWYLDSSFTSKVTEATTINTSTNHTLYAKWNINTYTVTFNGNGGSSPGSKTMNYGASLSSVTSTRSGYIFNGWYTAATGGTKVDIVTSNATYYAHWTANSSTLTINPNGGKVNNSTSQFTVTKDANTSYSLTVNSYPAAYTVSFNSNGGSSAASKTAYRNSVTWEKTGGGTLNGNTFTFGTTNATISAKYTGVSSIALPSTSKTATQYCTYSFGGWYNGSTKIGNAGAPYTPSANITLTAKWTTTYKTATLDTNGFKNYLNIHNAPNSSESTIIGYAARNATCTVSKYENEYYYTDKIYDSEHGKYVSGWIHSGGVTVK